MRDFVVIGGGVAGCAAAHVLASDDAEVLVMEAGPGEPLPAGCRSIDFTAAAAETKRWWAGDYLAGRGIGGGSAVNGMVVQRPDADDPAVRGLAVEVDAVLDALEAEVPPLGPLARRLRSLHGNPGRTTLDPPEVGFAAAALSTKVGKRRTAADVWLDPALANLTFFAGNSVETWDQASDLADRVVVAAGALRSPDVVGVEPKPALDHPSVVVGFSIPEALRLPEVGVFPAATCLVRGEGCQLLFMDHTGDAGLGRAHGAVVVIALQDGGDVTPGLSLARRLLVEAGVSAESVGVEQGRARVAHACGTLSGLDLPTPVVDAATLVALPSVNPMVAVAAHARATARSL